MLSPFTKDADYSPTYYSYSVYTHTYSLNLALAETCSFHLARPRVLYTYRKVGSQVKSKIVQ